MCLGNNSKDSAVGNMKQKRLNKYVYEFLVDYESTDVDDILDIRKYVMKKKNIKQYFGLSNKCLLHY